jgi:outer membrane protein OmpA-like peptidoglycan-associated protein
MKTNNLLILVACAGFVGACATIPNELVNARQAYQLAAKGPAARVAPAELHVAHQALLLAEQSFKDDSDSYHTRDLAYVASRKSELAQVTASIAMEQNNQTKANKDYQETQGKIVAKTKQDLSRTRTALAESERSGKMTAGQLSAEQDARTAADQRTAEAQDARTAADQRTADTRAALVASEHSGDLTAERLRAEREARAAAEKRAAVAQAALAKLAAVKEEPRGTVITLSGSVLFASNRAILLPAAQSRLDQVVAVLLTTRERNITIEGHTDSRGSESYNIDLSQRRADAVRNYLVKRDYEADRIQAHGLGEGHPIADNSNAEGRANNRRVEIIIERDMHTSNP